jgi:hypothetical protein
MQMISRKRCWDAANGGHDDGTDVGPVPIAGESPSSSSSSALRPSASILVAAISASENCAAPLRRHLSKRGAMFSLLLLGGGEVASANDHETAVQVSAALKRVSGRCIAQLLSVLYDEVQSNRNVEAVLRFVHWVLSVRFDVLHDDLLDMDQSQRSQCRPISEDERSQCRPISEDERWIPCLVFMLCHNALTFRVKKLRMQDKKDADGGGGRDFMMTDGIVTSSVLLIERVRCMDTCSRRDGEPSVVERCFSLQLSLLRRIVAELERNDATPIAHEQAANGNSKSSRSVPESRSTAALEKDWWDGVDLDGDFPSSEEECGSDAGPAAEPSKEKTIGADAAEPSKEKTIGAEKVSSSGPNASSDPVRKALGDEWVTIEGAALDLRAELIEIPPGATLADIQSYTDRISSLIRRAGTEHGADGVAATGSILHDNTASTSTSATRSTPESTSSPLTDILIQQLCKTCIDGSTSAIRAAAFIRSFVLPLARNVGIEAEKKKPSAPSRILTATITSLAKERPIETVEALFIPILKYFGDGSGTGEAEPNQTQADLVSKTIKNGQLSEEAVSRFVVGLVEDVPTPPMVWNDSTMPILTILLSKRPNISDETAKKLAILIREKAKEYCKNSKFSTLFHTLITKNGTSIQEAGCVDELTKSANELKTFMGKSIKVALKKISKTK